MVKGLLLAFAFKKIISSKLWIFNADFQSFTCAYKVIGLNVLTRIVVIYSALCLDGAQGQMNQAPNKTQTHSWRFACLAC